MIPICNNENRTMLGSANNFHKGPLSNFTQHYSSTIDAATTLKSRVTCNIQNIKSMPMCLRKKSCQYSFNQQLVKVNKGPTSLKTTEENNIEMYKSFKVSSHYLPFIT